MSNFTNQDTKIAWISGRETWQGSLAYGEVVVPKINLWEHAGSLPRSGKVVGQLDNGTRVTILNVEEIKEDHQTYYDVSSESLRGWVSESFIAWNWSCFTFIGNLSPIDACIDLDLNIEYAGMELLVKEQGFAIVTEGDPNHFESIKEAVSRFANRITNAQAPLTTIPLHSEFSNWVEISIGKENGRRIVGFLSMQRDQASSISVDQLETAHSIIPLMATFPYLDLALSDFFQALNYPQHALIFLARSIESIETHFSSTADRRKDAGKEKIMRELLGIKKSDVEYITKRANASHRRHASPDATAKSLPPDELAECFKKTSEIIAAFVTFLGGTGL